MYRKLRPPRSSIQSMGLLMASRRHHRPLCFYLELWTLTLYRMIALHWGCRRRRPMPKVWKADRMHFRRSGLRWNLAHRLLTVCRMPLQRLRAYQSVTDMVIDEHACLPGFVPDILPILPIRCTLCATLQPTWNGHRQKHNGRTT